MFRLNAEAVDLILHVGDIAYNMYEDNGKVTDQWMNLVEPYAASYPYMTIPGNHENYFNFTHYTSRYSTISNTNPFYYR
jgi:predicted MPP superfamily phosphohydrolase